MKKMSREEALKGLDASWLANQASEKQAGLLLRAFRVRRGLTQSGFAEAIFLSHSMVSLIELGNVPVPLDKMLKIKEVLCLSDDEFTDLDRRACVLRIPADRMDGLDSEWLNQQPPEKQAGLLLRAFRVRRGLALQEVATRIFSNPSSVGSVELGNAPVPLDKMLRIKEVLSLSDDEMVRLKELSFPLQANEDKPRALLEPEWFDALPDEQKAGQMLRAYRVLAYKTIKQGCQSLNGTSVDVWGKWERGVMKIPDKKIADIQKALSLTEGQVGRLRELIALWPERQSKSFAREEKSPPAGNREAGGMLKNYRVLSSLTIRGASDGLNGISSNVWKCWELGTFRIPDEQFKDIQKVLSLSDEQLASLKAQNAVRAESEVAESAGGSHVARFEAQVQARGRWAIG